MSGIACGKEKRGIHGSGDRRSDRWRAESHSDPGFKGRWMLAMRYIQSLVYTYIGRFNSWKDRVYVLGWEWLSVHVFVSPERLD